MKSTVRWCLGISILIEAIVGLIVVLNPDWAELPSGPKTGWFIAITLVCAGQLALSSFTGRHWQQMGPWGHAAVAVPAVAPIGSLAAIVLFYAIVFLLMVVAAIALLWFAIWVISIVA